MLRIRHLIALFVCGSLALGSVACSDDDEDTPAPAAGTGGTSGGSGGSGGTSGTQDIVDTAVAAGSFTTLAGALTTANLVDTLKGTGPFTVFAPTDDAFAKLPAGTLDSLTTQQLTDILTYHVVMGKVEAAQVVNLTSATTLQGGDIAISVSGSTVTLNGNTTVTMTDVQASNGVIHVIDTVLMPPAN